MITECEGLSLVLLRWDFLVEGEARGAALTLLAGRCTFSALLGRCGPILRRERERRAAW